MMFGVWLFSTFAIHLQGMLVQDLHARDSGSKNTTIQSWRADYVQ